MRRGSAFFAVVALALGRAAAADDSGVYVSAGVGLVDTPDNSVLGLEDVGELDLPEELLAADEAVTLRDEVRSTLKEFRDQAERDYILAMLKKHGGNISRTAQELGVRRPYLHRRMAVLGILKKDYFG